MAYALRVHFDNSASLSSPHLWAWYDGSLITHDLSASGSDGFGKFFDLIAVRNFIRFKFRDGTNNKWEPQALEREVWPLVEVGTGREDIWCKGDKAFVYHVEPKKPSASTAASAISALTFLKGMYIPDSGGLSGLGALPLKTGGVLFGLYHPNAARVYVAGEFNDWQCPGSMTPNPAKYLEMDLHPGWFGQPNTWLKVVTDAKVGDQYKMFIEGGVPRTADGRSKAWGLDPYSRALGPSFNDNNAVVVSPALFEWTDNAWTPPNVADLIIYELSVYGFTEGDQDIGESTRGRFAGITERIRAGYFQTLGVTALSIMPLVETPTMQSGSALGYNPSLYFTIERDFGSPDDFRAMVNAAHNKGLAVLIDQVFNHTDNDFNPLWRLILEHPNEDRPQSEDGGLYFNGTTPWGNRVATEKVDVQNMLIDCCKMWITEYHIDGFRFDATHTNYMDHGFVLRLANELKTIKPNVILVAENLPNQSDLNRSGFDGFAQWCDAFHDKMKALLREGLFEGQSNSPDGIGDVFFFSKGSFAGHTNNAVNYCESHDEHSVAHEVSYTPWLDHPAAKERKSRLGLFSSMVGLGQPMLYMGQEFLSDRPRNTVTVQWPPDLNQNGFFQWTRRLIGLRRRYPGLRMYGYNPEQDGQFSWILGPWMDAAHGGGNRMIGWIARPNANNYDVLTVFLNFEGFEKTVDLELGLPGVWVKLADTDIVSDVPPGGTNSSAHPTAIRTDDGRFAGFTMPSSSGFIYKWQAP